VSAVSSPAARRGWLCVGSCRDMMSRRCGLARSLGGGGFFHGAFCEDGSDVSRVRYADRRAAWFMSRVLPWRRRLPNAIWALWAASVVLIAVSGSALALAASTRNPPTEMYSGSTHVGRITPTQIGRYRARVWDIECDEGSFLTRGRSARERTRINLHHWDGVVEGYARLVRGRWLIYRIVYRGEPFALAAAAVHRSHGTGTYFEAARGWVGRSARMVQRRRPRSSSSAERADSAHQFRTSDDP
jgi:hypothetical protein